MNFNLFTPLLGFWYLQLQSFVQCFLSYEVEIIYLNRNELIFWHSSTWRNLMEWTMVTWQATLSDFSSLSRAAKVLYPNTIAHQQANGEEWFFSTISLLTDWISMSDDIWYKNYTARDWEGRTDSMTAKVTSLDSIWFLYVQLSKIVCFPFRYYLHLTWKKYLNKRLQVSLPKLYETCGKV